MLSDICRRFPDSMQWSYPKSVVDIGQTGSLCVTPKLRELMIQGNVQGQAYTFYSTATRYRPDPRRKGFIVFVMPLGSCAKLSGQELNA